EPTDIVVFRGEARDGASTGGTSGEGASYRWQEAPRLEIPYHGAQPATRRWNGRIAAVVAIAALIGAVGGALATSSISRLIAGDKAEAMAAAAAGELKAARTAVSKLETQVASLKADADKADKAAKA